MARSRLVLGVDGGGTKTLAVLAEVDGEGAVELLGYGRSGPANMQLAGRATALASLEEAIGAAVSGLVAPDRPIDHAVLALAGTGSPEVRAEIEQWVEARQDIAAFDVIHDTQPVLEMGTPESWGVALIVGTGSVAVGRNLAGRTAMRGGWGHWFGDLGSGYDLGRQALAATAQMDDGMAPPTAMAEGVLAHFGLSEPRGLMPALARRGNTRREIAALAPVVLDAAAAGDTVAQGVLARCSTELARLVCSAASSVGLEDDYPLALAGGVICGNRRYRDMLERQLGERSPRPGQITLVHEPVLGCLAIARQRLAGSAADGVPVAGNADLRRLSVMDNQE